MLLFDSLRHAPHLWFVFWGMIVAANVSICGLFVPRHFVFCNEKAGIGAFDVSGALE